jgi:cytochrome b561
MAMRARGTTEAETQYGAPARLFHWLTVALLLVVVPLGLVMGGLPRGRLQDTLFVTHESLDLTVLGLTALRFLWRLTHPVPPPSADLRAVERVASGGVHALLYLILLAMPISGYLFVVGRGIALSYFGLAAVPALVAPDKALAKGARAAHATLQWAVYALAALHVAAALHHSLLRRNDVLARMLPAARWRS